MTIDMKSLARLGARACIQQLAAEIGEIRTLFPGESA